MAKGKATVFFCQDCGYESSKWMGQCPGCREWNTMVEETVVTAGKGKSTKTAHEKAVPASFSEISLEKEERMQTHMEDLYRVPLLWSEEIRGLVSPRCFYRSAAKCLQTGIRCCISQERSH